MFQGCGAFLVLLVRADPHFPTLLNVCVAHDRNSLRRNLESCGSGGQLAALTLAPSFAGLVCASGHLLLLALLAALQVPGGSCVEGKPPSQG